MPDSAEKTPNPISPNLGIAHLFSLCGLAISPLYTTLQQNPAFFVANDIWPSTIVGLVIALSVGLPLILSGTYSIAGILNPRLQPLVHITLISLLLTIAFLPLTSRLFDALSIIGLVIALTIGAGLTRLVYTNRIVSIGLGLVFPVTLWFPTAFLMSPGLSEALNPHKEISTTSTLDLARTPPIVMLILDELPTLSLLDSQGEIDARRFPNFASLANQATWYPYATTVHDYTLKAIPALLTGNYPDTGPILPLRHNYPDSLFNALSDAYTFHTLEQATSLGPETNQEKHWHQNRAVLKVLAEDLSILYLHALLPRPLANRWIPIEKNVWGGLRKRRTGDEPTALLYSEPERLRGWRMERMEEALSFIDAIGDYPSETLHLLHVLLPHSAWDYLPSGRKYNSASWPKSPAREERWPEHVGRSFQHAHLLQTGAVDHLLGQLIDTLKSHDLYDDALIVVAADHGIHFEDDADRRILSSNNAASIGFVPLIIKFPRQRTPKADSINAQLIDVTPTILDVLMDMPPPQMDGRSLIQVDAPDTETKHLFNREDRPFEFTKTQYESMYRTALKKQSDQLSLRSKHVNLFNAAGLDIAIGAPSDALNHQALTASIVTDNGEPQIEFDPASPYVAALLTGTVTIQTERSHDTIAIVATCQGKIAGTAPILKVDNALTFAVAIDDTLLKPGRNDIGLLVVPATN